MPFMLVLPSYPPAERSADGAARSASIVAQPRQARRGTLSAGFPLPATQSGEEAGATGALANGRRGAAANP